MSIEALREAKLKRTVGQQPERLMTEFDMGQIYRAAFETVCNKNDWRGPINAVYDQRCRIPIGLLLDSIEFMTAVKPMTFDMGGGKIRILCEGYRNGPAA